MIREPWADDPDRTTRRETYLTEVQFDDELDLLSYKPSSQAGLSTLRTTYSGELSVTQVWPPR